MANTDVDTEKREVENFRREKDDFFRTNRQSPLSKEQKRDFAGLRYFPYAPELRVEGAVEVFPEQEHIQMQTSTGDVQEYTRYGRFLFHVDGADAALTIYQSDGEFFLPFADSLAGKETYGAGRYLEPFEQGENRFLVDFNYAYNPYCAYNEAWSCPLTPFENRLKVPIPAGEKIFHEE